MTKKKFFAIVNLFFLPLYLLSRLMPRWSNTIIIGSNSGMDFADNSKYLLQFYWFKQKEGSMDFKLLWITRNKQILKQLREKGLPSAYIYSFSSIYHHLTCKIICFTHQNRDYLPSLSGGAKIVALWHGFPLKRIGPEPDYAGMTERQKKMRFLFYKVFPYLNYMNCNYVLNPYASYNAIYERCFAIAKPTVLNKEQPRVAALKEHFFDPFFFREELLYTRTIKSKYRKLICWMPTHRMHRPYFNFFDFMAEHQVDFIRLDEKLKEANMALILKLHPIEASTVDTVLSSCERILLYPYADPYPLLSEVDILMTDFSSVAVDFAVLQRPIVFFQLDREAYLSEIGLYVEPDTFFKEVTTVYDFRKLLTIFDSIEHLPVSCLISDCVDSLISEKSESIKKLLALW